jgi:hypothetical protein
MHKLTAPFTLRLVGLAAFAFAALSTLGASSPWAY